MNMAKLSNFCYEKPHTLLYQEIISLQMCYTPVFIICNSFVTGLFVVTKGIYA